jgi:pyridoxamine 5'-phosphate oxidase
MAATMQRPYHHPMHAERTGQLPDPLPAEPLQLGERWLREAFEEQVQPNPNSMVLATVDAAGQPSARVVLCKDIVLPEGYLVFYTNYESKKGAELERDPRAAAVFFWDTMHRQMRMEGTVVRSPAAESDDYFASRAWQSRLGAWASAQSRPIGSRRQLLDALKREAERFGVPVSGPDDPSLDEEHPGVAVPRPPHWGGYRLWIASLELWVQGAYRIHDRARWTRTLTAVGDGHRFHPSAWHVTRLQP